MSDVGRQDGPNNQATFERRLAESFPAIAAALDEIERGLLHLEMAAFATATRRAIEQDMYEEIRSQMAFIDQLFLNAAPDLENAIYVSYLENVFLGETSDPYVSARRELSPRLQQALIDLEAHWNQIEKSRKNRP